MIDGNITYFLIGLAIGIVGGWIVWRLIE